MPTIGDNHPAGPGRRGLLPVRPALLAAGVACGLTALAAAHAGAQTPPPSEEADGLVHASLVLEGQEISVAFPPDLAANDPAYAELLAGASVRLGTFEGHRALRMGTIAPDLEALPRNGPRRRRARRPPPGRHRRRKSEPRRTSRQRRRTPHPTPSLLHRPSRRIPSCGSRGTPKAGASRSGRPATATTGPSITVPLSHADTAAASPVFTASVRATAAETGRLELRWGRQAWSSDFRFEELPPPPRRPRVSGRGTPRQAADDNSPTARNNMLNERNETALVLPDGARISMLY